MKKTITVNVGSVPFVLNVDAYDALDRYLKDVRSRIADSNADEIMADIEGRIAEIFSDKVRTQGQVVDLDMITYVISVMGKPETFADEGEGEQRTVRPVQVYAPKKLYRSRKSTVIGGVCAGLAEYLNIDISLVRIIALLLVLVGGVSFWIYIIMWIVIPLEPLDYVRR